MPLDVQRCSSSRLKTACKAVLDVCHLTTGLGVDVLYNSISDTRAGQFERCWRSTIIDSSSRSMTGYGGLGPVQGSGLMMKIDGVGVSRLCLRCSWTPAYSATPPGAS